MLGVGGGGIQGGFSSRCHLHVGWHGEVACGGTEKELRSGIAACTSVQTVLLHCLPSCSVHACIEQLAVLAAERHRPRSNQQYVDTAAWHSRLKWQPCSCAAFDVQANVACAWVKGHGCHCLHRGGCSSCDAAAAAAACCSCGTWLTLCYVFCSTYQWQHCILDQVLIWLCQSRHRLQRLHHRSRDAVECVCMRGLGVV